MRDSSGHWEIVTIREAIDHGKGIEKRCIECKGQVRAHRAGMGAAHFEHMRRHQGCRLGDCYDGNGPRPHPLALK